MKVYVCFDAEITLVDEEVPDEEGYGVLAQAVQSLIGHTGAVVLDVTEYEYGAGQEPPE